MEVSKIYTMKMHFERGSIFFKPWIEKLNAIRDLWINYQIHSQVL